MNSDNLIEKMSAQDIVLKRFSPTIIVEGLPVPSIPAILNIRGAIQPTSGEDLKSLPEGQRERVSYKVYSVFQFRTNNQQAQTKADIVELYGEEFEVQTVQNHFGLGLSHWKAIAVRKDK